MSHAVLTQEGEVATVCLARGKVNALNDEVVRDLNGIFHDLENDDGVRAVVLTGSGKFFSFGFDIPEFLSYGKASFTNYLKGFTKFCTYLFLFPKPVVAALNGHTVAGGCMLTLACDHRIMVEAKAKMALNEIGFGASVFAGSVEMLRYCVGSKNAEDILFSGKMYSAAEALQLGLIDEVAPAEQLAGEAARVAREYAGKDLRAFASIKNLLRKPVVEGFAGREAKSVREFVDIWYSESTWKNLELIKIEK
jgi:enoyl-CoA hydratase/carnithine racemase